MKTRERERDSRDSILLLLLILLVGFICIIVTSGWALRFSPSWKLPANMRSNLNPDSDFLTNRPPGFYEPIDPAILTPPDWVNVFLTPGSTFLTHTPGPKPPQATDTPAVTLTNTPILTITASPTNVVAPTNTLIYFPPPPATATSTKKPKPPAPTATPTATAVPALSADLSITKTDNATDYAANLSITYVIVASNAGPDPVTGATVTDVFSANPNLTGTASWTCIASTGALCNAGSGDLSDTVVLPVGGSVQYTVSVTANSSPVGSLVNSATISSSVADPNGGNNTASDTDQLVTTDPPGNIGPTPDGSSTGIPAGSFVTLQLGSSVVIGSHGSFDIAYFPGNPPPPPAANVPIGAVELWVGDGKNWYQVFNWGDGLDDANTNISGNLSKPPNSIMDCTSESDGCQMDSSLLYNFGSYYGIAIDLDGMGIPVGTSISYIRIFSNGSVSVDAVQVLP